MADITFKHITNTFTMFHLLQGMSKYTVNFGGVAEIYYSLEVVRLSSKTHQVITTGIEGKVLLPSTVTQDNKLHQVCHHGTLLPRCCTSRRYFQHLLKLASQFSVNIE
jgi:hypothetical protein